MHKSQAFFYLLISFILGVFLASFIPFPEKTNLALFVAAVIVAAVSSYRKTFPSTAEGIKKRKTGFLIGILILFFSFGVSRFNFFTDEKSVLGQFADREVKEEVIGTTFIGYIDGEPERSDQTQKFFFKVKAVIVPERVVLADDRILVTAELFPEYHYGDRLRIEGKLERPKNFGEFDYVKYLEKDQIRTVISFPENINKNNEAKIGLGRLEDVKISFYKWIFSIKRSFQSGINRSVPEPSASYINGILLGTRENIPDDLKEAFNKTSTTHILAISGYNITIIAEAVLIGFILFFRRRTAFWISIGIIIAFTIMTGASASVVRAAIMGLLLLFAQSYGRLYDAKNSIVLAGAAMIYLNPMVLSFDIGFQLSFLAVFGLIYLYPLLDGKLHKIPKFSGLKEISLMTFSAQIFVLPLLIYHFNNFSFVSLPANIIILPFVPYAMLFGFLSGLGGMAFAFLGQIFGLIAWAITYFQLGVIRFFASLSFSSISFSLNLISLIVAYIILILVVYKLRTRTDD